LPRKIPIINAKIIIAILGNAVIWLIKSGLFSAGAVYVGVDVTVSFRAVFLNLTSFSCKKTTIGNQIRFLKQSGFP
jgi:hypothetical protein